MDPHLVDRSGTRYAVGERRWRGDDGSPLAVAGVGGLSRDEVEAGERSLWRYAAAIAVAPEHRLSLGEGWTPLVPVDWAGHRVHAKLEWINPTASFKDRGVAVMVSHLRGQGAREVLEDSSGNGGASVSAYAAAAGMRATVLVPSATSPAKVLQVRAHGAEVVLVDGTRDDVAAEAVRRSADLPYASHSWHPFFLQGTKTIGYEIWEQLGWTAPDSIVLVAGAGSLVLGCDLAFTELLAAGQVERRPRLLVGQPEHWASIADAVNGTPPGRRGPRRPTVAEGASIAHPVRLPEAVEAIRRSGGAAAALSDRAIRAAVRALAAKGLYAEPTSAVAAAALDRFIADGTIGAGETTVLVLTGSGLKAAETMARIIDGSPETGDESAAIAESAGPD